MSQTTNNFLSLETAKESHKNFLIFLLIVLLPLICFSNSLLGDFVYDDLVIVKDNPNLKTLSDIPKLFLQPYWGENNNEGLYRPLAHVTYAINFAISKDDTYSYHLVNIFIHIVSSLLIYWLSNHYCKSKYIALLCSLFFAVHPVHCEAVAAIYGRPELLATFFLLLAWLGFAKGKTSNLWYIFSLINYFLSLLCKESGIVFIGVLLLVQICAEASWKEKLRPDPKLLGYIFATIPYLAIRVYVTKAFGIPKGGQFLGRETFLTRVYTMSLGYLEYFRMLIWPDKLYTEYTFDVIPRATSPNITVIFAMLVILSLVVIGILQINKKPALSYAILFFFVTTSIVSNIFIPTGVLIAERTIYFPVAAVCLLLALILYQIHKIGWQKTSIVLAIVLLTLASIRTYYRNFDFKDNFALFGSVLKLVPNHFKMTSAIAGIYEERGELLEAEKYYKKLIEIAPRYTQAYSALANLYVSQGFDDKALPLLEKAIEISPSSANAYVPLGRIYLKRKDFPKAVEAFQKASSLIIPNAKLQHELALAIFYSGDLELAEKEMNRAIKLDPYFVEAKVNLAKVLQKQNKIDQAQSLLDQALALDPNDLDIYITYGSIFRTKKELCKAKDYLLKALSFNPQLSEAHYQLGLVYSDMNLYNEAKRELELHLKLSPSNNDARKKLFELNKNTKTEPTVKCP